MAALAESPKQQAATTFEIVANRQELLAELSACIGVIERKTTIPILANMMLEARVNPDSGRSELVLSGTNLDQSIRTSLPVTIRSEGVATVPARKLYEYVRLLAADEVAIRVEDNFWLYIRGGRSKTKMVGMAPGNFPILPTPEGDGINLDAKLLRVLAEKALLTVSDEESRYTLNGALLILASSSMAMVSTDSHRLTHVSASAEVGAEFKVIVPTGALKELRKLLAANEDVEATQFWETPESIFFRVAHTTLTSRKIAGQFPNFEVLLNATKYPRPSIVLEASTIAEMLTRALLFAEHESRAVAFYVAKDSLRVHSAASGIGETDETLDIFGGPEDPFVIGFNGDYLRDLFANVTGNVEADFADSKNAARFTWRTDDGVTLLLLAMPMKLNEAAK